MRNLLFALALCTGLAIIIPAPSYGQSAAATSSPSAAPPAGIPFRDPTSGPLATSSLHSPAIVYLFATGGDSLTQQRFVSRLTQVLETEENHYSTFPGLLSALGGGTVHLIPEQNWGVSDYTGACQKSHDDHQPRQSDTSSSAAAQPSASPSTDDVVAGAFIINISSIAAWVDARDYVWTTNHTKLWANLYYSVCDTTPVKSTPRPGPTPQETTSSFATTFKAVNGQATTTLQSAINYNMPSPSPKPQSGPAPYSIAWGTQLWDKEAKVGFATPLSALSVIMVGIAAYEAFTPTVTKSTTTTTTFPTPTPGVPVPPYGYVSSSSTSNQKATNANQFGAVSSSFLSGQGNISTNLPLSSTNDRTTESAVNGIVDLFVLNFGGMQCPGTTVGYTYLDPSLRCFVMLTSRNDGPRPQLKVDTGYSHPSNIVIFNDCHDTYLGLLPNNSGSTSINFWLFDATGSLERGPSAAQANGPQSPVTGASPSASATPTPDLMVTDKDRFFHRIPTVPKFIASSSDLRSKGAIVIQHLPQPGICQP